jgi:hypothetical protein
MKGTRKLDLATGAFAESPPVPRHDFANIGETALQSLIVEKKYQTVVCPSRVR